MKSFLPFLLLTFVINCSFGQEKSDSSTTFLKDGPPEASYGRFPLAGVTGNKEIIKHAVIDTGLDSVQMYFGLGNGSDGQEYKWIAISHCSGVTTMMHGVNLEPDSGGYSSNDFEIKLHEGPQEIALKIMFHPEKGAVKYKWFNEDGSLANGLVLNEGLLQVNKPFPNIDFNLLDGSNIKLSKLKGKVVVINWWATSCGPCIQEMPMLNQVVKDNSKNEDVLFYAVAQNEPEEVTKFLRKRDFAYKHGIYNDKFVEAFGKAMPVNVVVDKEGNIVYYSHGFSNSDIDNKKEIDRFSESINKALSTQ